MNNFLKTYRLALTPLSPIHIGCGEDFEPTNYVIDDGVLYGFDPSRAVLNPMQRDRLKAVALGTDLMAIQRFFRDNAAPFKAQANLVMPVCQGVAQRYNECIGQVANREANNNDVINALAVERHVYTGTLQQPFIPGTSFKGALRTAWLDDLNAEQAPHDVQFKFNGEAKSTAAMEKRLLKGDFDTSPLRLLKVADLMPIREPEREVLFAVNRKKKLVHKDGREMQPKGIAARKDCVLHGQYRLFQASVTLPSLDPHIGATDRNNKPLTPSADRLPVTMSRLATQSNTYNRQRLQREMQGLDGRGLLNRDWKQAMDKLLAGELGRTLEAGQAFLVRLGRYGGADSKTLTGEGVASIKIMGAKGQPPTFESTTKTVWLAAQTENDQKHLLPFGWAVVEIDPQADCLPLLRWCQSQAQDRPNMAVFRDQLHAEKATAHRQQQQQAAEVIARTTALETERVAAEQRALALASMSAQGKKIETLRQQCEDWVKHMPPNGNFKKQAADVGKLGLFQDANQLTTHALESPDWTAQDRQSLANMLEECLPNVVAPWEKDQRKKLKLSTLRGL